MTDLDNTSLVWVIIEQSYHYKESTVLYLVTPFTTISVVLCLVRAISIFIFFLFNIQLWILDKMHSFSYFKSELWKRLYFRDKVI